MEHNEPAPSEFQPGPPTPEPISSPSAATRPTHQKSKSLPLQLAKSISDFTKLFARPVTHTSRTSRSPSPSTMPDSASETYPECVQNSTSGGAGCGRNQSTCSTRSGSRSALGRGTPHSSGYASKQNSPEQSRVSLDMSGFRKNRRRPSQSQIQSQSHSRRGSFPMLGEYGSGSGSISMSGYSTYDPFGPGSSGSANGSGSRPLTAIKDPSGWITLPSRMGPDNTAVYSEECPPLFLEVGFTTFWSLREGTLSLAHFHSAQEGLEQEMDQGDTHRQSHDDNQAPSQVGKDGGWHFVSGDGVRKCGCEQTYNDCPGHPPWFFNSASVLGKGVRDSDFQAFPQWGQQCWNPAGNGLGNLCKECDSVQKPWMI